MSYKDRIQERKKQKAALDATSKPNGKFMCPVENGAAIVPGRASAVPWPVPLGEQAFHGLAGEFVRLVEPHTESDPAALLIQFVTFFGTQPGVLLISP